MRLRANGGKWLFCRRGNPLGPPGRLRHGNGSLWDRHARASAANGSGKIESCLTDPVSWKFVGLTNFAAPPCALQPKVRICNHGLDGFSMSYEISPIHPIGECLSLQATLTTLRMIRENRCNPWFKWNELPGNFGIRVHSGPQSIQLSDRNSTARLSDQYSPRLPMVGKPTWPPVAGDSKWKHPLPAASSRG